MDGMRVTAGEGRGVSPQATDRRMGAGNPEETQSDIGSGGKNESKIEVSPLWFSAIV